MADVDTQQVIPGTELVKDLRAYGFEVYDFRHPTPDDEGFSWGDLAANWKSWSVEQYWEALDSFTARDAYMNDSNALYGADALVLLLPSGRSAHIEAGMALGRSMPVYCLAENEGDCEPELMYLPFKGVYEHREEMYKALIKQHALNPEQWGR